MVMEIISKIMFNMQSPLRDVNYIMDTIFDMLQKMDNT